MRAVQAVCAKTGSVQRQVSQKASRVSSANSDSQAKPGHSTATVPTRLIHIAVANISLNSAVTYRRKLPLPTTCLPAHAPNQIAPSILRRDKVSSVEEILSVREEARWVSLSWSQLV